MIFYNSIEELNNKLIYYSKNNNERMNISAKGYLKAHKIFNNKLITNYMLNKIFNRKNNLGEIWMK